MQSFSILRKLISAKITSIKVYICTIFFSCQYIPVCIREKKFSQEFNFRMIESLNFVDFVIFSNTKGILTEDNKRFHACFKQLIPQKHVDCKQEKLSFTHREKTPSKKTYKKYEYGCLESWYIKSNLYKRLLN